MYCSQQMDAAVVRSIGSVREVNARRKAQCDKISNGVRGLTERDAKALHFVSGVARSYCRADVADVHEDEELSRSLIDSYTVNWARTLTRLVALSISGELIIYY
jgi:hypothetical protein